jgi:hypothetical protein
MELLTLRYRGAARGLEARWLASFNAANSLGDVLYATLMILDIFFGRLMYPSTGVQLATAGFQAARAAMCVLVISATQFQWQWWVRWRNLVMICFKSFLQMWFASVLWRFEPDMSKLQAPTGWAPKEVASELYRPVLLMLSIIGYRLPLKRQLPLTCLTIILTAVTIPARCEAECSSCEARPRMYASALGLLRQLHSLLACRQRYQWLVILLLDRAAMQPVSPSRCPCSCFLE